MKTFENFIIFLFGFYCLGQEQAYYNKVDSLVYRGSNYIYTHQDSANFYFEKIFKLASQEQDWEIATDILEYKNFTAGYHYNLSAFKKNIERIDSLVSAQPGFFKDHLSYRSNILLHKGNYYFKIKDFKKSRFHFNKFLSNLKGKDDRVPSGIDAENILTSNEFLATMYLEENKLDLALELYEHNLRFIEKGNLENMVADKIATERLIAKLYTKQGNYELANYYFEKCVQYYIKSKESRYKNNLITTAFELTKNYHGLGREDSTKYYLKLAKENLLEEDPFWPNYYRIEGDVLSNRDFEKALSSYQHALQLFREKPNRFETSEIVLTLQKIGQLYEDHYKPEEALGYYQNALQEGSTDFSSNDFYDNPAIEGIPDKSLALDVLKKKAHLLTKSKKYKAALSTTDTSIDLLDFLRTSFESNLDKQYLFENAYPVFETGLWAAYNLYLETNDIEYLDTAFHYTEKSKTIILLEAIYSSQANRFSKVPDYLLEKEQQLRAEITFLEKQLKDGPSYEGEEDLFQAKNNYRSTLTEIENKYADYFNLKYNPDVVTINKLQKILNQDEALITYFYGDSHLYSLKISIAETEFTQLRVDSIVNGQIRNYWEQLQQPDSDLSGLSSLSHQLYGQLLEPHLAKGHYKKLYIIPDGLLNYLPFESFITQTNPTKYLVENVSASYANSATLLLQLKSEKKNLKLLSIAPSFENSTIQQLQPLPNNVLEARKTLDYFKGELLLGEQATLANFQRKKNDYDLFHFATHAILDDEFPEYSYLAFTPTTDDEDLLFISDLYNLRLDAALVSLSACETGIGDLRRGEGFISLSRAFFYSGAKSIVNTLWKITDYSSSEIMADFYGNLSKGMYKDEALRQAQLSFLQKHREDKLSHPYYWSSFVVSGNIDPIVAENEFWLYLLLGGLFLVSLIAVAYKRRKGT